MKTRNVKKGPIKKISIFVIKTISKYFWEIADTCSYKNEKIAQRYNKSIKSEYKKEYETYGIPSNAKILHIGCGAYPLTEIVLATFSDSVVGIDKNIKTANHAQEVIQRNNLQDKITIKHENGLYIPVKDFDVIIVSSCAVPKIQILEYLFKNASPQCKIIVREVDIVADDILQFIKRQHNIEIVDQMCHNQFPFFNPIGWKTFYTKKK